MEESFPLESSWIVVVVAGAIALIMLLQLARSLPGQNIAMIAVSLLVGEGLLELLMVYYRWVKVPSLTWYFLAGAALLWVAVVLSARRLAQFILQPWRREKYYGLWVIIMSTVATVVFQFGWPCVNPDPVDWKTAEIMAAIRGVSTVLFLLGLAPWLIRKRPVSQPPRSELAQQPKNEAQ